ncbi:AfsR/SARP family transcriptional regulator [Amycolatopsis sp. A1MSW2902]|uniref:AfsR/SARP family transcriptional regulator n=1 Tax=Amycolatopsis sp. A1MSW2902 TaxID=687413 RepID=UPI00307CD7E1
MELTFQVLGPVRAVEDGITLPTEGERPLVVLAGLLTHPGQEVGVAQLTRWLWDGDGPRNARASVHTTSPACAACSAPQMCCGPGWAATAWTFPRTPST